MLLLPSACQLLRRLCQPLPWGDESGVKARRRKVGEWSLEKEKIEF